MFGIPIYVIVPLFLGLLAALGTLAAKRALEEGGSALRLGAWSCVAFAAIHLPLLFWAEKPGEGAALYQLLLPGLLFFGGLFLFYWAIEYGEVSIATPLMGTKSLLVMFLTAVALGEKVEPAFWIAAVLVLVGVGLMRSAGGDAPKRFLPTVALALLSCVLFAVCDVMIQAWKTHWGLGWFGPILMLTAAACGAIALVILPRRSEAPTPAGHFWFWLAILIVGLQTLGFVICLLLFDHPNSAAALNVTFNSRGIWSVLLVWMVGHWFGNREREQGIRTMGGRLAGAICLFAAIALTIGSFVVTE